MRFKTISAQDSNLCAQVDVSGETFIVTLIYRHPEHGTSIVALYEPQWNRMKTLVTRALSEAKREHSRFKNY